MGKGKKEKTEEALVQRLQIKGGATNAIMYYINQQFHFDLKTIKKKGEEFNFSREYGIDSLSMASSCVSVMLNLTNRFKEFDFKLETTQDSTDMVISVRPRSEPAHSVHPKFEFAQVAQLPQGYYFPYLRKKPAEDNVTTAPVEISQPVVATVLPHTPPPPGYVHVPSPAA
jgi:hypothetical protein